MTRKPQVARICHKTPHTDEMLIEMAQAEDDQAYFKTMSDKLLPAVVHVNDAITLVLELFKLKCQDFVERRQKTLAGLKQCTRMEVIGGTTMRLYKGHTQIGEGQKSPENIKIYRAYYNIHHLDDPQIDDLVPTFSTKNQLIHHFERTRTNEYFNKRGEILRGALKDMLEWINAHS